MASKGQRWMIDSGILRKKDGEEDSQELLVFGYSCKLFRDDEKARMIDQGRHLIPWMADNSLKIDRYDGRGALGDLRIHEPPPGGFDLRQVLTEDERKVENICDEERYRSLYNNDAEETMYHEEEIKRLHQALDSENPYGQVAYNYNEDDNSQTARDDTQSPKPSEGSQEEEDHAFVPPPELEIPEGMILPDTQKLNAIITKTALFISQQGGQMEILIKAKQANNPQFSFLSIDGTLHPYYRHILAAIKEGKYNPEKQPENEESESEEESDGDDDESYLHPSLAPSFSKVESAPSIPSIQYKPSADCAYSMLVNKITGKPPPHRVTSQQQQQQQQQLDISSSQAVSTGGYYSAIPPPPPPPQNYQTSYPPLTPQQYAHGPVIYGSSNGSKTTPVITESKTGFSHSIKQETNLPLPPGSSNQPTKELSTIKLVPYGETTTSTTLSSSSSSSSSSLKPLNRPSFIVPPAEVQIIIDKMASYVSKNGRDFEAIVKSKGDPRFNFLELSHQYHGYYAHKLGIYDGGIDSKLMSDEELLRNQEPKEDEKKKKLEEIEKKQKRMEEVQKRVKMIQAKKKSNNELSNNEDSEKQTVVTTVSFSIKKPKDCESGVIEKRSALPIEESDDEDDCEKRENIDSTKSVSPPLSGDENLLKFRTEKKKVIVDRVDDDDKDKDKDNDNEFVDLTEDIFEDCQNEIRNKQAAAAAEERMKDKIAATVREKISSTGATNSRERQLQIERKRKAAMFLSQIQNPIVNKKINTISNVQIIKNDDSDEVHSIPSPTTNFGIGTTNFSNVDQSDKLINGNSLMNRLKGSDLGNKRPRLSSRSRSRSRSRSDKNKQHHHKKHKKKKISHKSYDSPSSSRQHKSKKSKKSSSSSSSRHRRSRSITPSIHHRNKHSGIKNSRNKDSNSSESESDLS